MELTGEKVQKERRLLLLELSACFIIGKFILWRKYNRRNFEFLRISKIIEDHSPIGRDQLISEYIIVVVDIHSSSGRGDSHVHDSIPWKRRDTYFKLKTGKEKELSFLY